MIYRARPILVEAIQFTGDNWDEIQKFTDGNCTYNKSPHSGLNIAFIETTQGTFPFFIGDYITKDSKGRIYPYEEGMFYEMYDEMDVIKDISGTECPCCHKPLKRRYTRLLTGEKLYRIGCFDCDLYDEFRDGTFGGMSEDEYNMYIKVAIEIINQKYANRVVKENEKEG